MKEKIKKERFKRKKIQRRSVKVTNVFSNLTNYLFFANQKNILNKLHKYYSF